MLNEGMNATKTRRHKANFQIRSFPNLVSVGSSKPCAAGNGKNHLVY